MLNEKVDIEINGRRLTVAIEGVTPMDIHSIAKELSQKLAEIQEESKTPDTSKLALLAAVEYLVEIMRLKNQQDNLRQAEDNSLQHMTVALQSALHASQDPGKK